mmetsp:Transcript_31153/g.89903  ORF Transcript_31153/g.89903 Transcript_31153/m.89903 type:complete len:237 (+) Transcript_31153:262-972(+)
MQLLLLLLQVRRCRGRGSQRLRLGPRRGAVQRRPHAHLPVHHSARTSHAAAAGRSWVACWGPCTGEPSARGGCHVVPSSGDAPHAQAVREHADGGLRVFCGTHLVLGSRCYRAQARLRDGVPRARREGMLRRHCRGRALHAREALAHATGSVADLPWWAHRRLPGTCKAAGRGEWRLRSTGSGTCRPISGHSGGACLHVLPERGRQPVAQCCRGRGGNRGSRLQKGGPSLAISVGF